VHPLIRGSAVVPLEEDPGTGAIRVDDGRDVVPSVCGNPDRFRESVPLLEAFGWGLHDVAESRSPKLGETIGIFTGEDDLN